MRILFLPKYPRMGASSRLRTYQFIQQWEKSGYEVEVSSFFNDSYLKSVYSHRRPSIWNVLGCYFRRFKVLLSTNKYDLIWIEKEAFPFLPSYAEWLLNKLGKGYVVDYDDAVFHNYDQHAHWLVRTWMGNKIEWVMRNARLVSAGNMYLQEYALDAGAKQMMILPTVIPLSNYPLKTTTTRSRIRIGWIGSPTTLKYLASLAPMFQNLGKSYAIELLVINAPDVQIPEMGVPTHLIPWVEEKEGEMISEMDIGIMPLPDDKWERGKCAYKLIQYMACGLPVVASPVGMNKAVVRHGENGFLADTHAEWHHYLGQLITDPLLRTKMGKVGRALIEKEYTIELNFSKMQQAITSLLNKK